MSSEVSIMKPFCNTCLSEDRELKLLDCFHAKATLLEWFSNSCYKVNVDRFQLCWECYAKIIKFCKFKRQVLKAQQLRIKFQKKKAVRMDSLSKLSVYTKAMYDGEYVFQESEPDKTETKEKTSKRKKEHSRSQTKTKRKKAHNPNPEPNNNVGDTYNIYHYYNKTEKVTLKKGSKPKKVKKVIDLTKDPKLCAMPFVLLEKEVKHEVIDADDAENGSSTPAVDEDANQNRPSVIMKVEATDDAETYIEELEDTSLKFSIVNLTEDQMLKTREVDRNERIYMKNRLKCESCVIGFAEKTELDKHKEENHSELIGVFECPICSTRFNNELTLTRHEQTHYLAYKCRQCDFDHHRRYEIEMHVVKEHDLTPSPVCAACDTEFATQERLNAHFEKAHKERLKCKQCAQSFETVDRLKDHADSHKEKDEVVEIFTCEPCKGTFEGKAAYRAHVQCVHKELAQYAYCSPCDLQFNTLKKFKLHLREHSLFDQLKFDPPSSFTDTLACDIKRSHRMLSHTCGLCKKGFSDAQRMKLHIQEKHPQVVTMTEPATPSSPVLDISSAKKKQSEVVTIEPAKDKKCPICSDGFVTRIELLDHMRTHKAEKHFKCYVCDKSFATDTMLRKHSRTHESDNENC